MYRRLNFVQEYFSLRKMNDDLATENARLRETVQAYLMSDIDLTIEKKINTDIIRAVSAKVINNSVNKQYNYITLNKGIKHGIKPYMGIICPEGVVGVIINVSENYSTALSVLNGRWSVNAKLEGANHFGPLRWQGGNPYTVILEEIPYHVSVEVNEKVLTSGYSATFPEGILIGRVAKIEHNEGESFQKIWVQLSVDFKKLHYVEVIENITKQEQIELENLTNNE
jgi:rod shape-determining protein MreC